MLRSMYSGVSGLRNHQTRLDVIGNNIANVNTIGFKSSRVTFKDLFSQTLQAATSAHGDRGGSNPVQVGLGMTLASIDTNHTDGSIQYTGKDTDLAIEGSGFFIIRNGSTLMYTRAGNFDLDEEGYLVVPGTGYRVQGLEGGVEGKLSDIRISTGITYSPEATGRVEFANNLNVEAAADHKINTPFEVFDSLGCLHTVDITFTKIAQENAWEWEAYSTTTKTIELTGVLGPGAEAIKQKTKVVDSHGQEHTVEIEVEVEGNDTRLKLIVPGQADQLVPLPIAVGDPNPIFQLSSDEQIELDISGLMLDDSATESTLAVATANHRIGNGKVEFDTNGKIKSGSEGGIQLQPAYAGSPQEIMLNFSAVTGAAESSSLAVAYRNGAPQGSLRSYSIDGMGKIIGEFSNGLIEEVGQVALARFANPAGLTKVGNTAYTESNNSGLKQVGQAGSAGFGSIASSSLEMSNVDLSLEFTEMIVTQRGLQANSRIITTSDEVLQEVVNLKR